jgi:type I restriction enzyme S subunit
MSWEESNLDSLCEEITVGYVSSMAKEYTVKGIPFLRSLNIEPYKLNLKKEQLKFISEAFHRKLFKSSLNAGDLAIVRTGLPGTCCVIPKGFGEVNCSDLVIARPKKSVNPYFLCYYINSPFGRGSIGGNLVGVAQKHFNVGVAKRMMIPTPPLPTQKRIADILSAYDDLIENNLRRIKLLEQAAQNIYKEWFVNLRFPGHENTPINEETGLPKGWEIGVISDFGKVVTGKTPSTKRSDFYGEHIPFIKTPDMHGLPYVIETNSNLSELGQQDQLNKNLPTNSVLVSCIGTAGTVALTSKISQTNQQINSVVFDSTFKSYYFYCFAKTLKPLLEGLGSNGATMVNVNKGKFENIDLNIPAESFLVEYAKIAEPMFDQMLTLSIQNQKLKAARDILLPRLMNRTIEV